MGQIDPHRQRHRRAIGHQGTGGWHLGNDHGPIPIRASWAVRRKEELVRRHHGKDLATGVTHHVGHAHRRVSRRAPRARHAKHGAHNEGPHGKQ